MIFMWLEPLLGDWPGGAFAFNKQATLLLSKTFQPYGTPCFCDRPFYITWLMRRLLFNDA